MRWFHIFKKRKVKAKKNRRSKKSRPQPNDSAVRTIADIESLQAQLQTVHIALDKHDQQLSEHSELIKANSEGLRKLEEIVEETKVRTAAEATMPPVRPVAPVAPALMAESAEPSASQKFDINRFSEQEKRILAAFFHNKDMALSYVDIARALNKSPHTVKNQMNQMRLKADLFDRTVDRGSRNRFRLKDSLKIEKYLNIG